MQLPKRLGKYGVRAHIGEGSMAHVYRAHDSILDRDVALKVLKGHLLVDDDDTAEILSRFAREARIAANLRHEHFVAVYDYVDEWDPPFIAMELIDGKTLSQLLRENHDFSANEVVIIVLQLLSALGHAHAKGVIHRDIKAQNIFLLPGPHIKITDFGIAQVRSSTLTQSGSVMGSAAYMSPEQFRGAPVDHRSDLWSVGIVLYELLSGRRPFRGSVDTVRDKVLTEEPVFDRADAERSIPSVFEPVIRKTLSKSPERRYQSAEAFSRALEQLVLSSSSSSNTNGERHEISRRAGFIAAGVSALGMAASLSVALPSPIDEGLIAQEVRALSCAAIDYTLRDRDVVLTGVAGDAAQFEALRSKLSRHVPGHVENRVSITGKHHCALLDLVRALSTQGGLVKSTPMVTLQSSQMHEGAMFNPDITAPQFRATIALDYVDATGRVTHLVSNRLRNRALNPRERTTLRDVIGTAATYEVACPCGPELIIGIASSTPALFANRPEVEGVVSYVDTLRRAIHALPKDARVAIHVLPLTTLKR